MPPTWVFQGVHLGSGRAPESAEEEDQLVQEEQRKDSGSSQHLHNHPCRRPNSGQGFFFAKKRHSVVTRRANYSTDQLISVTRQTFCSSLFLPQWRNHQCEQDHTEKVHDWGTQTRIAHGYRQHCRTRCLPPPAPESIVVMQQRKPAALAALQMQFSKVRLTSEEGSESQAK